MVCHGCAALLVNDEYNVTLLGVKLNDETYDKCDSIPNFQLKATFPLSYSNMRKTEVHNMIMRKLHAFLAFVRISDNVMFFDVSRYTDQIISIVNMIKAEN